MSSAAAPETSWEVFERLDTTRGSIVHRLFAIRPGIGAAKQRRSIFLASATIVAVTYVLQALVAFLNLPTLTERSSIPIASAWIQPARSGLAEALCQQISGVRVELRESANLRPQYLRYGLAMLEQLTCTVKLRIGRAPAPEPELRSDGP